VLTGKIPDLSSLSSLKHLHLHQNELTGEIPASLGQLSNLGKRPCQLFSTLCPSASSRFLTLFVYRGLVLEL
jgi:hypothetical protein